MKFILRSALLPSVFLLLTSCGSNSGSSNAETMDIYRDHPASLVSKLSVSNNPGKLEDGRQCSLKIINDNKNSLKFEFNYVQTGKSKPIKEVIGLREFEGTNLDGKSVSLMRIRGFLINERTHQVFVESDGRVTRFSIYGLNSIADCKM
jgi:hypothetical protein